MIYIRMHVYMKYDISRNDVIKSVTSYTEALNFT